MRIKEKEIRLSLIKKLLVKQVSDFEGGRLENFVSVWRNLTSDSEILDIVSGLHIEFDSFENCDPFRDITYNLLDEDIEIIDAEVDKLLSKKVIAPCLPSLDQNVSPVFTCPKKDGTFRMILNLKKINTDITYKHFKMDSLQSALQLVTPCCFMTSVDLKDAYYSVPIAHTDRLFLRFWWRDVLYEFKAMPNGLALAPRKFTKLLKPVFAKLRDMGHASTSFIDDSMQVSVSYDQCLDNVLATIELLMSLGFVVHPEKSVFTPSQRIVYLGFIIDSFQMMVFLTQERTDSILALCKSLHKANYVLIRDLARVIGKIISTFPAVRYGPLFYRLLEENKKAALKDSKGDYDCYTQLTDQARSELKWWLDNICLASKPILISQPEVIIESDASLQGWGCKCTLNNVESGGVWLPEEATHHINFLELKAGFIALKCFENVIQGKHVRLLLDNSTAVALINKMGTSHSIDCNELTFNLWCWCKERDIWVSAAHIPGKDNKAADAQSRKINLDAEWMLNSNFLSEAIDILGFSPDVDLFASRANAQFHNFFSYKADPEAVAIDAFSVSWASFRLYAFPPFSVLLQVLAKIQREKATGIVVVPDWKTQVWWPLLLRLLKAEPWRLPRRFTVLQLPAYPERVHPLLPKLQLLACLVSGAE